MDNTFIKDDLIERYVLNQLNDEELATFRGQLMFDENLRKQVVETKMLMSGLAVLAKQGAIATPVTASAATQSNTMRRAAMIIGVLLLAGMTYYFVSSSDNPNAQEKVSTTPIENPTPKEEIQTTTPQDNSAEESKDTEEVQSEDKYKGKVFAGKENSESETTIRSLDETQESTPIASVEEEMSFGEPLNPKLFPEDEGNIGYADAGAGTDELVNSYIEDAINNNTTKSRMGVVEINDFENGKTINIDKNGAVDISIKGTIDTKAGNNKQYVFKLFDNDEDKFINNMPLDQQHLKPKFFGADKQPFTINSKIELKPGLYYFTIEEEIDDDQDMIYAGRFYVQAGKFEVKDK